MTMTMTMMPLCHDDDCSGDGGGGERGGGGRGVGDGHPGHGEDGQLQQGELAFVNVIWYAWLPCEEMQKKKDMALLSFVLNFFHGVLIGKKEKVLLTVTVCLRACVCLCVCLFCCVFVCLCLYFCDGQESVCVAPLLILRGLKCLTPVTRFPLRPP